MSVPIIPKIVVLSIDGEDFAEDVIDAAIVPAPGAIQKVTTLDGVTHQDALPESWALELNCVQDWDSVRPGLAYYLFENKGTEAAVIYNATGSANAAGTPAMTCTVRLVPIAYGGQGQAYAETKVVLPITGDPVLDPTP